MEHGATLYDKLEDTLKVLSKKYKLFIVSNCQDGYIETFMKFYNLDKYFVDFECPGRTNLSKAENIKIVIERNNLKHPVYVGDTQMDCDAAKKHRWIVMQLKKLEYLLYMLDTDLVIQKNIIM